MKLLIPRWQTRFILCPNPKRHLYSFHPLLLSSSSTDADLVNAFDHTREPWGRRTTLHALDRFINFLSSIHNKRHETSEGYSTLTLILKVF